jgi:hypothetical protein
MYMVFSQPRLRFDLSEDIKSDELRLLFEQIVHRMRTEAAHLPMNTVQQLVIERIARCYVLMLQWERAGKFSIPQQMKYTEFWMKLATQFNMMLLRAAPAAQRDAFLERIALIIAGVVSKMEDAEQKQKLLEQFMLAFKEEGLN